jgi:hypothetical protein
LHMLRAILSTRSLSQTLANGASHRRFGACSRQHRRRDAGGPRVPTPPPPPACRRGSWR